MKLIALELTFIGKKRIKNSFDSYLDGLKGIGPKTKEQLLKEFKSVKRIKESSIKDFMELFGEKKGKRIFNLLDK